MESTDFHGLEALLNKVQRKISTFWAISKQGGCFQAEYDKNYLTPIFAQLNNLIAQSLWLFAGKGDASIESIYLKSVDTSVQFISDIVSWSDGFESDNFPPALRKLIHNSKRAVLPSLYIELSRSINEETSEIKYEFNGYTLSPAELEVFLEATSHGERGEIWSQLLPQLQLLTNKLIQKVDGVVHEYTNENFQFNPLFSRYEVGNSLLSRFEASSKKLFAEHNSRLSCDGPDAHFDLSDEWGVIRASYQRYLPAFLPALENLITRTELLRGSGSGNIKWPFNVSFGAPSQHKIYLSAESPLENLFDLAHHVGHALHQDLVGGDGLYNGVISQSLDEVLPLLSESILLESLPSYFELDAAGSAVVNSFAMKRVDAGVLQPWQIHQWQREFLSLSATNKLDYSSMIKLWDECFPSETAEYMGQKVPKMAWLLNCKQLFQFPAVSPNALGGVIALTVLPNLLNEPQHYSAILWEKMIDDPLGLIRVMDSFLP